MHIEITAQDRQDFARDGFIVKHNLLSAQQVEALRDQFPKLFRGEFDTGVYPDEWHWREGMSRDDVTRHMANLWKSDLTTARIALSEAIAQAAATLAGWTGARMGQDTIWWKPPGAKAVAYHQDTSFMRFLDPAQTITCWIALDDTHRDAGTLEYAPGSHHWPITELPNVFAAEADHREPMRQAARAAGVEPPAPFFVEIPAGSCTFHSGEAWHGSAANATRDQVRRSLGIHLLPEQTRFSNRAGGYIYRRYQLTGDPNMNESFFPILWSETGQRTPWIEAYLETGSRT